VTWVRRGFLAFVVAVSALCAFDYAMSGDVTVVPGWPGGGTTGGGGAGGGSASLDLGSDSAIESMGITNIRTSGFSGDSADVFTECLTDAFCVDGSIPWPTSVALAEAPDVCAPGEFATGVDAGGNALCESASLMNGVTGGSVSVENELVVYDGITGQVVQSSAFNSMCTAANTPYECCAGLGTGTCQPTITAGSLVGFTALSPLREKSTNGSICVQESIDNCSSFGTAACEDFCFTLPSGGFASDTNVDVSAIALATGEIYTGVHDYGGATSLEIPNGAAPSVDAAGKIGVDTTADQLKYFGSALRVLSPVRPECAIVENLAAADDNFEFFMDNAPSTITGVGCRCRGTCTGTATLTLEDRGGNAMTITSTNPTCATTGNSTFAAVTAGNQLAAGEGLAFDVTNTPNPETDEYTICVTRTLDAQ
jgi:hypothetical protein